VVVDTRHCAQCGAVFAPRREHARFCCSRCRLAWNRARTAAPSLQVSALRWSVTAMSEATDLLAELRIEDPGRAFAAIGDAVWSVTMVDATLIRHHHRAYDAVLADLTAAEQRRTEDALAGLRFVRNRIAQDVDLGELVEPGRTESGAGKAPITDWTWKSVPEPDRAALPSPAREWEIMRHRAYQTQLAGHLIAETFPRLAAFLRLTAAKATTPSELSPHRAP
jgi:predicted nucleic acid-binding Zn ribbon protein